MTEATLSEQVQATINALKTWHVPQAVLEEFHVAVVTARLDPELGGAWLDERLKAIERIPGWSEWWLPESTVEARMTRAAEVFCEDVQRAWRRKTNGV
jgi:hypothetical protein